MTARKAERHPGGGGAATQKSRSAAAIKPKEASGQEDRRLSQPEFIVKGLELLDKFDHHARHRAQLVRLHPGDRIGEAVR
jgi:hypothetical protein